MIIEIAMVGFTWLFMIGFLVLTAVVVSENDDYRNSKAYKDLNETMLNRNEDI